VYHNEGYVERRPVRPGIMTDEACEIVDGLAEGELIASTRTALLADGLSVRAKEQTQ
jgi:hypothetical protein